MVLRLISDMGGNVVILTEEPIALQVVFDHLDGIAGVFLVCLHLQIIAVDSLKQNAPLVFTYLRLLQSRREVRLPSEGIL